MKRVLTMRANIMATSLLTAAVVGVTLFMSAVAGGSPLFKSDHESDGVTKNNEVRSGIDHPSRVGSQQGATLSATDFLFINNHEEYKSVQPVQSQGGYIGSRAGLRRVQSGSEIGVRQPAAGLCHRRGGSCCTARHAIPAAKPATQLSYGNLQSSIGVTAQNDSAAEPAPACSADAPVCSPAGILQITRSQRDNAAASGHHRLHDNHEAVELLVCLCQALLAGPANPAGLTPSKIVYSKPDLSLATTGRPALYLLLHGYCRHCNGGVTGGVHFKLHPDRVTAMEVGL